MWLDEGKTKEKREDKGAFIKCTLGGREEGNGNTCTTDSNRADDNGEMKAAPDQLLRSPALQCLVTPSHAVVTERWSVGGCSFACVP